MTSINNEFNDSLKDLPMGFSFALAKDLDSLNCFANMSKSKQKVVVDKARHVNSKKEMQNLVQSLKTF